MQIPIVSVIIPTYNALVYLEETLSSVLSQTYKNIEIILVDDGSTDGTNKNFRRYQNLGIKCIYQTNQGVSSARNAGLENCIGAYIQFLDADDIIHPEKIEKQLHAMLSMDAVLSYSTFSEFNQSIKNSKPFPYNHFNYSKTSSGEELMISFGTNQWIVPVHGWLTKKTLIDKAGAWDTSLEVGEDLEYFARVLFRTKKVICFDEVLAYYRRTKLDSLSKASTKQKVKSNLRAWQKINSLCIKSDNNKLAIYPKFGFLLMFSHYIDTSPKIAKIVAHEFDNIKHAPNLFKNNYYTKIVELLGLYTSFKLHKFIRRFSLFKATSMV